MNVVRFERRDENGWPLVMHVVELGNGELLIHSPTRIDDRTYDAIAELGTVRYLFAPNHFHNVSIDRYAKRFPRAVVIASHGAIPRLRGKVKTPVEPRESVELPKGAHFLVPEGTKSGEAWLSIDGANGPTWIVCDAFFNETRPVKGLFGFVVRRLKIAPGLCVGRTYTFLALRDSKKYLADVLAMIQKEKPVRVLFSHGDPLEENVSAALTAILRERIG